MPQELSPLLSDKQEVAAPDYDETEQKYNSAVKAKLEKSRDDRDQEHSEFDGMTYIQWHENNEKLANTFVGKKANKSDTNYASGTVRQKLFAFLAAVNRLNLSGVVQAFDKDETMLEDLGLSMTDIIRKTEELDDDQEKKMMRQYEMLKQGDVFVQELWKTKFKVQKTLNNKFDGKVKGVTWQKELKEYLSIPSRDILWSPGVYLGNFREYFIKNQPHLFTVDVKSYAETASLFQNWERWQNVPRRLSSIAHVDRQDEGFNPFWSITDINDDQVEIIRYEDKWNDEFMIFCNGVMMLPVGFPLSAISANGEYTLTHQGWKIIHGKFAYHKSLPMELRNKVAVYDEMVKMAVLKNQQSYAPPTANNTGRVLSSKIWFPGKIIHGVDPEKIKVLNEKFAQGVTQGEVAMMNIFKEEMDDSSINKAFQGSKQSGSDTATESLQIQEQSAMIVGLTEFSCELLEKKLVEMRFWNIIKNWFKPVGTVIDTINGIEQEVNKYRTVNVEGMVAGKGMGRNVVVPTDRMLGAETDMMIKKEEEASPVPMRKRMINVPMLMQMATKMMWQFIVQPIEKKTSSTKKLMFRAMLADAAAYFQRDLNIDYLEERFATIWEEDKNKLFMKQPEMGMDQLAPMAGLAAPGANPGTPPKTPSVESKTQNIKVA